MYLAHVGNKVGFAGVSKQERSFQLSSDDDSGDYKKKCFCQVWLAARYRFHTMNSTEILHGIIIKLYKYHKTGGVT